MDNAAKPRKGSPPAISELPDGRWELRLKGYMPVALLPETCRSLSDWEREVVVRKLNTLAVICCTAFRLPMPWKTGRIAEEGEMFAFTDAASGDSPLLAVSRSFVIPRLEAQ